MKRNVWLTALLVSAALTLGACGEKEEAETRETETQETEIQETKEPQETQEPKPQETQEPEPQETKPQETQEPQANVEEGSGEFTYTFDSGVLTISGKGVLDQKALKACGAGEVVEKAGNLQEIRLEEGVTKIGEEAFEG